LNTLKNKSKLKVKNHQFFQVIKSLEKSIWAKSYFDVLGIKLINSKEEKIMISGSVV
jgi:hypothetical protein